MTDAPRTLADELGRLRLIVNAIDTARGGPCLLRFQCFTCSRLSEFRDVARLFDVPAGRYPRIDFSGDGGSAIVLPFDVLQFRGHLLHDVRAEWNRAFVTSHVSVQEWRIRDDDRWIEIEGPQAVREPFGGSR